VTAISVAPGMIVRPKAAKAIGAGAGQILLPYRSNRQSLFKFPH